MKTILKKLDDYRWDVMVPWFERNEDKVFEVIKVLTITGVFCAIILLTGLLMEVLPE